MILGATSLDTFFWVERWRRGLPPLVMLVHEGTVLIHPWRIGELACSTLRNRAEVLLRIEREQLMRLGVGSVDAHLLVSATLSHCPIWTQHRRPASLAQERGLAIAEPKEA